MTKAPERSKINGVHKKTGPKISEIVGFIPKGNHQLTTSQKRLALRTIKTWCRGRNIDCSANLYSNNSTHLPCRCTSCGHKWMVTWANLQRGRGCPKCRYTHIGDKRRLTTDFVRLQSAEWGVFPISEYRTAIEAMQWGCVQGHIFSSSWNRLTRQKRCGKCGKAQFLQRVTYSEDFVRQKISERGWMPTFKKYINARERLEMICANGHSIKLGFDSFLRGTGCGACFRESKESLGERFCRLFLERLYGGPFPKRKDLPWLIGNNRTLLELDGFNEQIGLAFEHQGNHHRGEGVYANDDVLGRDKLKRSLVEHYGHTLVEFWQVIDRISFTDAPDHIVKQLRAEGFPVPDNWQQIQVDPKALYKPQLGDGFSRVAEFVQEQYSGTLLSSHWLGWHTALHFRCHDASHPVFPKTPDAILNGKGWCPKCADEKRGYSLDMIPFQILVELGRSHRLTVKKLENYKKLGNRIQLKCQDCDHEFLRIAQEFRLQPDYCKNAKCNLLRRKKRKEIAWLDDEGSGDGADYVELSKLVNERYGGQVITLRWRGWHEYHRMKCAIPAHPIFLKTPADLQRNPGNFCRLCKKLNRK